MLDKLITLTLVWTPISIFLGKWTMGFFILLNLFLLLKLIIERKMHSKILACLVLTLVIINYIKIKKYFYLDIKSVNPIDTIEYAIRIIGFINITYFFSDKSKVKNIYQRVIKYHKLILIQVVVAQINLLYLFITGKGYSDTWGLNNFIGPYQTPHTYAYSLIIMIIIIEFIYIITKNKKIMILYIFPLLSSIFCGARTPVVMMWIVFIVIRTLKLDNIPIKKRFKIKTVLIITFILIIVTIMFNVLIDIFINSSIFMKFLDTSKGNNFDNGRTDYWIICLEYYKNSDIFAKIVGNGIYSTVLAIKSKLGYEIWAHSDWIDILNSYGIIMLSIYI